MWWWVPWIVSTNLLGGAVILSYSVVLFNAFGDFPVPQPQPSPGNYLESPYWLGLHKHSTAAVAVFQVFAMMGYVVWQWSLVAERPTRGLLTDMRWLIFANTLFLLPSVVWPFAAHKLLQDETSLMWAILSSSCLWLAAMGLLVLVGGTFEDNRESPQALVGLLFTSTVVVVADGAGWSALAIYKAVHT
jgi:hypothetical protein